MLFFKKRETIDKQYSLHDGATIFLELKQKLSDARLSIRVAATWFTDNELFQILLTKKKDIPGCSIEVILDDNKENYWLPFMDLIKLGGIVKLSSGLGSYGRMHQKFCIIDNNVLISGSYNWSKNARTENHENVIVSSIRSTVDEFNAEFEKLLTSSTQYDSTNIIQGEVSPEEAAAAITERETFVKEFEKVLDEMIYSSVVEYNRDTLVAKGYERSEKCAGDSNIIYNELDTVYTEMLNSISASEQRKEGIQAKVSTHLQESTSALKEKLGRQRESVLVEEDNLLQSYKGRINYIRENNQRLREEIITIEETHIVNNNNSIQDLKDERNRIQEESIKMPFRWYIEVPTYIGLAAVFIYIVLFYSSAAYILMFSEQEAKAQILLGLPVEKMGIFYPQALSKASDVGVSQILVILFVPIFLVCGLVFIKKLKTQIIPKWIIKFICLILIDGFTAIAVSRSIHENNYLAGIETQHFKFSDIFSDMNFYLVFLFGMLSLLIFDLIMSYILKNFESRNDIHVKEKRQTKVKQLSEEISALNKNNVELNGRISKMKEIIEFNLFSISTIEKDIQFQPTLTNRKITLIENETNSQITNLENIVKIAYNKIDNELFNFSTHFIKDRINIFLQGWNNFIYSYYSKTIAENKVQEAKTISNNWFQTQFSKSAISKPLVNEHV